MGDPEAGYVQKGDGAVRSGAHVTTTVPTGSAYETPLDPEAVYDEIAERTLEVQPKCCFLEDFYKAFLMRERALQAREEENFGDLMTIYEELPFLERSPSWD